MLVIEDNVDAAEVLREILAARGHEIRVVESGRAALIVAREFRPDVVLCDIGLPEMDGYAVARAFRDDAVLRDTYLVALTGYARPEDHQRANEAGFDLHLSKPAKSDVLENAVANVPHLRLPRLA